MGIPYSKEINKAFEELNNAYGQVTPLIEAGFEVLETTKNITFLLAGIQILTVVLLTLILLAMFGLLITTNPDLEQERRELVTPALKWLAGWAEVGKSVFGWSAIVFVMVSVALAVLVVRSRQSYEKLLQPDSEEEGGGEGGEGQGEEGEGETGEKDDKK